MSIKRASSAPISRILGAANRHVLMFPLSGADMGCADDEEAIEAARRLVDGHDIELWQAKRRVIRLEAPK
jgi:hypothetical protein